MNFLKRGFWRKLWYFIWKDDSMASWFVNVILAIIIVKLIIFPVLGFALGTSFPVVAVVSCSMEHGVTDCGDTRRVASICGETNIKEVKGFDGYWETCGHWYLGNDITKEEFSEFSFKNGFNKGDIMVLIGSDNIGLGDVIVFESGFNSAPIIHRVISVNSNGTFHTKGDHNRDSEAFEQNINKGRILGKAVLKIPYLGWVKVLFSQFTGVG